jgi:hypothetical protein
MRTTKRQITARALLVVVLMAIALSVDGGAATMRAQARKVSQACAAALGTYVVGAVYGNVPRSGVVPANPFYSGGLSGALTLSGTPSCGGAYSGKFAVHGSRQLVPVPQPRSQGGASSAAVTMPPIAVAGTNVLTATGTFAADPAHRDASLYVAVSGAVTYGRYSYDCAPPTGAPPGGDATVPGATCTMRATVTSTVTFSAVTGYVRFQSGTTPTLTVAFLPPPDSAITAPATAAFQALVLTGRRSGS